MPLFIDIMAIRYGILVFLVFQCSLLTPLWVKSQNVHLTSKVTILVLEIVMRPG